MNYYSHITSGNKEDILNKMCQISLFVKSIFKHNLLELFVKETF